MSDLPDPPDRLDSWKEIAGFLGRTVRTVQRWEKTEGLPVRRGGPARRGAVVASRQELREWWQRRGPSLPLDDDPEPGTPESDDDAAPDQARPPERRVGWWVALAAAAGLVAVLVWLYAPAVTSPAPEGLGRLLSLSTSEGQALREIPLESSPGALVVSQRGDRLFVALPDIQIVAVIDVATHRVIARLPVSDRPEALAVGPNADRLYVGGLSELVVVALSDGSLERVPIGGRVRDLAVSGDGRRVWASMAQGGLSILEADTLEVRRRPAIGCPMYFAQDRRGGRLFVSYQCQGPGGAWGHDAIEIIDEASGESLLARSGPPLVGSTLALSPDEQFLWADTHDACVSAQYDHAGCPVVAADGPGAVVHALNARSLDLVASIRVPSRGFAARLAFFPDGSRVLASVEGVHVVNTSLGHVEERLDLAEPTGPAVFTPDRSRAFVVLEPRHAVLELPVDAIGDARSMGGLGSYWPADGAMNDLAGGAHATELRGVEFVPGRLGQALAFGDAPTDVGLGTRFDVDVLEAPATFSAWVKPRSIGAPMTIFQRASVAGWRWWITSEGRPAYCLVVGPGPIACDAGGLVASDVLDADAWHHLAVVRSETAITIVIDGRPAGEASLAGYVPPSAGTYDQPPITRLGSGPAGTDPFSGLIDEVALFRRALSLDDIATLMRATSAEGR